MRKRLGTLGAVLFLLLAACTEASEQGEGPSASTSVAPWHGGTLRLAATFDITGVDERVDRCMSMVGSGQLECWVGLDRYLIEQVVPVIPFMQERSAWVVSPRVESFSFDQFTGMLAYDQMALVAGSE